ncbi:hypothetical protein F2Q70_00036920 [Brassica cretica]|uniref:Uncharacterized protein n=1 Tax=Brassica cretica TaxID=69181 RepID=A0A8S9JX74_BRACR|nr:hypothetical protein F2Q70_00036920 [Brassica cretica]
MSISAQNPDISGERQSGQDVRTQNVMACQAVSNIVKTSLGPVGLDKLEHYGMKPPTLQATVVSQNHER